jgi:Phytanoyl-CoA dioxygenase (PhyH)
MRFTKTEWSGRTNTGDFNALLTRALRSDGYFILEEVLGRDAVAELHRAFLVTLDEFRAKNPANRGANRYNNHLYLDGPFADEDLVYNPLIMPLLRDLLGIDLACTWAAADTPLGGSDYQTAHSDGRPLFRDRDLSLPLYAVAVNFPLVDFREDNGPLEIWPNGTHLLSDVDSSAGASDRDPVRVLMPAGSVLVRDTRMWHRGTPNLSPDPRPNLAFVYNRSWYRFEGEGGHTPPAVSPAAYTSWSTEAQRAFRFAATDLSLTAAHREECVMKLESLSV